MGETGNWTMANGLGNAAEDVKSESASTNASSGSKRKRAEPKFYAVRNGFTPGIYHSWADCFSQVKGFKGAICGYPKCANLFRLLITLPPTDKSFGSLTDAEAFINDKTAVKPPKSSLQKYYAVQCGRVPGVYTDWPTASKQITGWTKPKHKSFTSRAEAEAFVRAGNNSGQANPNVSIYPEDEIDIPTAAKKLKRSSDGGDSFGDEEFATPEPGTAPLPIDAEDGFDRGIIFNPETNMAEYKTEKQLLARKAHPTGALKGAMDIYTDGSALGNGRHGAIAGVGVYFGPNDPRNVSEALKGARQTNQRAELTAIQRALDIAAMHVSVNIYSDSHYGIQCVTEWFKSWRTNGWVTSAKKPVENKDLVEAIVLKIEEREAAGVQTKFTWLKGHANDPGNVAADNLAVRGAQEAKAKVKEAMAW
ncbi:ribonuclease H-like protein [Patellaria atrata CBS 101060]|uniref:Ribonuclease H n=1 Tax=Patellaria atrata CBS 101060 TaxID=1346257 RepID=A0A9P4SCR8_9PEZI|nr:ribonuclease H-like protein [Patellaria atrata CBS 101060]